MNKLPQERERFERPMHPFVEGGVSFVQKENQGDYIGAEFGFCVLGGEVFFSLYTPFQIVLPRLGRGHTAGSNFLEPHIFRVECQ